MDLVTVYKAFRKQAAPMGFNNPGPGGNLKFNIPELPPAITVDKPEAGVAAEAAAANAAPTSEPAKAVAKISEKAMDNIVQLEAMSNGITPKAVAGTAAPAAAPEQSSVTAGVPGMPQPATSPGIVKTESLNLGTIYKNMLQLSRQDKFASLLKLSADIPAEILDALKLDPGVAEAAHSTGMKAGLVGGLGVGGLAGYGAGKATYDLLGLIPALKKHKGWRLLFGGLTALPAGVAATALAAPTAYSLGFASKAVGNPATNGTAEQETT